ncbi:CRAL-TRIO domain-containing protein [Pilobolus umbonatus]|nr:CRAL-TRIO domain-containing protein [Pilobolus umbonatus]
MAITLTTPEKEAVLKLREALADIKKSAEVSADYTLWGVSLEKDSEDSRLDVILVKFLRARNCDLTKATEMLTNTLVWRRKEKIDDILSEDIDDTLYRKLTFFHKTDKEGRPVCYAFYGDIDQDQVFADLDKFIRWRIQLMEKGIQMVDFVNVDSMVMLHDYKDTSFFGRNSNSKAGAKKVIQLMQDNYPEFLAVKLFVNLPWWGSAIFNMVRPLLSEATVKKFVVCSEYVFSMELLVCVTPYSHSILLLLGSIPR